MWLELAWRRLREFEGNVSGGEVNWLSDGFFGERFPAVDFAHVDVAAGKQSPEQHCSSFGRRTQHSLRLDASLELLVQPLDRVGGTRALPLFGRQAGEAEQTCAGFLETVGNVPRHLQMKALRRASICWLVSA